MKPRRIAALTLMLLFVACGDDSSGGQAGRGGSGGQAGSSGAGGHAGTGGTIGSGGAGGRAETGSRRIFVTSTVQTANLGGISGADMLCATQARDAGLVGSFRAWLSTTTSPVVDRTDPTGGPFRRIDGVVVAENWNDLLDGTIGAPINLDAEGMARGGDVWTGTLADGTSYLGDDCAGFTSDVSGIGLCGASASTSATWTENITPACSTPLRLYCVEE